MSFKIENVAVSNQAEETLFEIYYWLRMMWEKKQWRKEEGKKLVEIFLLLIVNTQKIDEDAFLKLIEITENKSYLSEKISFQILVIVVSFYKLIIFWLE